MKFRKLHYFQHVGLLLFIMYSYYITGMQKLNFSGGEPFIHQGGRYVGELTKYCKEELKLPSVSIISNGRLCKEKWFSEYGKNI